MSNPQVTLQTKDSVHARILESYGNQVFSNGALDRKTKLLIALALDALSKSESGVAALSKMAVDAGASEAEILEAIQVAGYIGAVSTVFPAMCGLEKASSV